MHAGEFDGEGGEVGLAVLVHGEVETMGVPAVVPVQEVAGCEGGEEAAAADGELMWMLVAGGVWLGDEVGYVRT